LTQLWEQQAFKDPLHKTENWENFANQVGGYFTVGLISLAILVGSYWHFTDPSRWSNSVVSILVIACPCALAISYPFALGHGIRWLAKINFFIKDIQAFERMAQVDTIVLDKTGTLTLPSTQNPIAKLTRELSSSEWSALYSLALQSTHPMSRQFVRYIPKNQPIVHLEEFAEKMGKGLEAIIEGIEYRLGNAKFTGHQVPKDNDYIRSESQLYIQIGGISVGFIEFPWVYRAGIEVMIHQLQAKYKVYLLSGDKQAHAGSILDWFPDPSTYQFECSPMDKMKFIQTLQDQGKRVAMIGDGLNDAGALRQSHVGIAISDDHLHFTPASDAILNGEQLAQLPTYLAFSKFGLKLIKLSFLLSLVYNAIGLSYAVQGNLSPLIAAILMPVNSISMLLIANLGMSWKGYTLKS
jgi:Cu+-exporting ATPase